MSQPRIYPTTVPANLTSRQHTFDERQSLLDFWVQRYENAPDMRVKDSYTGQAIRTAGGQGLFIAKHHEHANAQLNPHDPTHPVNKAFDKRQREMQNEGVGAARPDRERLALITKVEKSALEAWKYETLYKAAPAQQDKGWFYNRAAKFDQDMRQGMEELLTLDRKHQHPVADAQRDLKKEPVQINEQYQWLTRDNRQLDSSERSNLLVQGLETYRAHEQPAISREPKASKAQAWFVDNATQSRIDARVAYEKNLDNDYRRAQAPGVPVNTQHLDEVLATPKPERSLAKTRQQLQFIDSPTTTAHQDPNQVMAQGIRQAASQDPEFARNILAASKEDRGQLALANYMQEVKAREKTAREKVGARDPNVAPLKSSDVLLLRAQSEARQVAVGPEKAQAEIKSTPDQVPAKQVIEAAQLAQSQSMSNEALVDFRDRLSQRRVAVPLQRAQATQGQELQTAAATPALEQNAALKARLAQLDKQNQATETKLGQVRVETMEKAGAVSAFQAVERRLANQHQDHDLSVLDAKRNYQRQQQFEAMERGERAPARRQEEARPQVKTQSSRSVPKPGGFEGWWSDIKDKAHSYKEKAVSLYRGEEIKPQQRTRPAGPGSSQQASAAKPAQNTKQVAPQQAAAPRDLRERVSQRPKGPGSYTQPEAAAKEAVEVERTPRPTRNPQTPTPTRPGRSSIDLGR